MEIIFLGTNGWYDTETGNTICTLIKTRDYYVILDAGSGIQKMDQFCKKKKPSYLFLSHFHLDHIFGLHILNKIRCFHRLYIFGPTGAKKILQKFINVPFTMPISHLSFGVELHELPKAIKRLPFPVEVKPLLHSSLTLGYRIEVDGKIISYCPDTGYCKAAVELSRNSDLLIAECAYKSGQQSPKWPHLNPESAARIAVESQAKELALVHFDAYLYKTIEQRNGAEMAAQKIFKNTFAAIDNMRLDMD
jgi:ribonuclease BN (tRNA processing enzyme)